MNLFITLLENVNKSRTSGNNVSIKQSETQFRHHKYKAKCCSAKKYKYSFCTCGAVRQDAFFFCWCLAKEFHSNGTCIPKFCYKDVVVLDMISSKKTKHILLLILYYFFFLSNFFFFTCREQREQTQHAQDVPPSAGTEVQRHGGL
jgi:hypothetical protein